jgi:hypothetical protein
MIEIDLANGGQLAAIFLGCILALYAVFAAR